MSLHFRSGLVLASWAFSVATAFAGDGGTSSGDGTTRSSPKAALSVWDTGTSSSEPLATEAVEQKNGWKLIASSEANYAFRGDSVIANSHLLAVGRKQGIGIELYSLTSGKPVYRARLAVGPGLGDRSK